MDVFEVAELDLGAHFFLLLNWWLGARDEPGCFEDGRLGPLGGVVLAVSFHGGGGDGVVVVVAMGGSRGRAVVLAVKAGRW